MVQRIWLFGAPGKEQGKGNQEKVKSFRHCNAEIETMAKIRTISISGSKFHVVVGKRIV